MDSERTVSDAVALIVEAGLLDAAAVAGLDEEILDEPLEYYGEPDHVGLLMLLDELGLRYSSDYKTYRLACQGGGMGYREQLGWIEEAGRGLLTITDFDFVDAVETDDIDGSQYTAHLIRFRCNGRQHQWRFIHEENEADEAQMSMFEALGELVPVAGPQRWCSVDPSDEDVAFEAVFGDPDALRRLGAEFDMTFEPL